MAKKTNWQLTRGQRLSYSVGMFSASIVTANVMAWLLYFYSPPPDAVDQGIVFLGAGLAVGLVRWFASAVDAVSNPLVAFWSDKSTHPRGRRIPFIVRGTVPLMLFAILVWFPPVRGASIWNVVWLGATLSAAWFFYTYVVAPYLALMPSITTDPDERVSLTVTMSYFETFATLIAALAVPPIIEALKGGVQLGPLFVADGFKATAVLLALLGAAGFYISVSRIREKTLPTASLTKFSLGRSVVECFRNPSFPPYLFAVASAKIAIGLVIMSMPFLATAVLSKGEGFLAVLQAPLFLAIAIGFALAELLVNRVGLKRAFRMATGVATLIVFGFFGTYFLGDRGDPLAAVRTLPNGDLVLAFAPEGAAPLPLDDEQTAAGPRHQSVGDAEVVRLTSLEWQGLFREADLEAFRAWVEEQGEGAAAGFLRADTAAERDVPAGGTVAWLVDQDLATLVAHLDPRCCTDALFPPADDKRRYDPNDLLFVAAPELEGALTGGAGVRLAVELGTIEEPAETWNLDGWALILSTPEQREKLGPAAAVAHGDAGRFVLAGDIRFADGAMVFRDFAPAKGSAAPASPALRAVLADSARLDALLSRLDLRVEFKWSVRIYLILALCFLLGFPAAVLVSMYRPIVCEIVDADEERVGTRREAMYFGVEGLLTKMADGVAAVVAPGVMLLGHVVAAPPFGYVLPYAVGALFMVVAYVIFGRYPLGAPTRKAP